MAATFFMVVTPASSFEISVYVAERIQNVTEYIVSTISDTIATFVTPSAIGRRESATIALAAPDYSGIDDGHRLEDEMTGQSVTSADVSTFAASAVTVGLALSAASFVAMWLTDNLAPSLLFPSGLFLATYGFWLINRAARRRTPCDY
jgi:hypothetical protein